MIPRRHLLATLLAAPLVAPFAKPARAQHQDLGLDDDTAPARPRRWMMEDCFGNVVTNEDMAGRFTLIAFGYTACPDVCPTTMSRLAEAMDLLGARATRVVPLFVTVDPERDTPQVLYDYTSFMHPSIVGLRGPKAFTDHMVAAFNARYVIHPADPDHPERYAIDHTASVALVGPDGMLIKRFPYGTSGEEMAADLSAILAEAPQ